MTQLDDRRIDIWTVDLDAPHDPARFAAVLTPEEADRAARFRFEHLRRHYAVARGSLRLLLGRYLGLAPDRVQLKTGVRGKPALVEGTLSFNVSHSGTVALLAFTNDGELGVDVEQIHAMPDLFAVAARFFCAAEAAELRAISEPERTRAFFHCWTRKEAYIKAIGEGLHAPLDRFRVTLGPHDQARFVHIEDDVAAANEWRLHDLDVGAGYAAAVAYRGHEREIRMFDHAQFTRLRDATSSS